jgi:serine/threonine protein kinase
MGNIPCMTNKDKFRHFTKKEESNLVQKYNHFEKNEIMNEDLKYNVLETIAESSEGSVKRVQFKKNCIIVKSISLKKDPKYKTSKYLEEHIEILKLQHSNIVRVIGYFFNDKTMCLKIFMENLDCNLRQLAFATKSVTIKHIASNYARQILEGLEYIHFMEFAHLDIKPENILIDTNTGTAKLVDFGCSKKITTDPDSTKISTVFYVPPEALRKTHKYDPRYWDIWSFGCTLYEFVYNCRLFKGNSGSDNQMEIINQILKFNSLKGLPDKDKVFGDFLKKCIVLKPENRWNCSQLLSHPFIVSYIKS